MDLTVLAYLLYLAHRRFPDLDHPFTTPVVTVLASDGAAPTAFLARSSPFSGFERAKNGQGVDDARPCTTCPGAAA